MVVGRFDFFVGEVAMVKKKIAKFAFVKCVMHFMFVIFIIRLSGNGLSAKMVHFLCGN